MPFNLSRHAQGGVQVRVRYQAISRMPAGSFTRSKMCGLSSQVEDLKKEREGKITCRKPTLQCFRYYVEVRELNTLRGDEIFPKMKAVLRNDEN